MGSNLTDRLARIVNVFYFVERKATREGSLLHLTVIFAKHQDKMVKR